MIAIWQRNRASFPASMPPALYTTGANSPRQAAAEVKPETRGLPS
jgi:hypothetical protein